MKKTIDPELITRYKKDQILELARRSLTSVGAHIILFFFVAAITPMRTDHPSVLTGFGILICTVSVLRLFLAKRVPSGYDRSPFFWIGILTGLNAFSGALWGGLTVAIAVFYPLDWPFMFTLVINCGLAAGATSSLGPSFSLSRNFTLLMMGPVFAWGIWNGTSLGIGVGILTAFSMIMFIRMAKDNFLWYWHNIRNMGQITDQAAAMEEIFRTVHDNAGVLNDASRDLSEFSGRMNGNAGEMTRKLQDVVHLTGEVSTNSNAVVSLIEQARDNVSSIASASEQMTATIAEIAETTQQTKEITATAVAQSQKAVAKVELLDEAAVAINRITESIGEISEQINLLALNATIEAARAGEAGRGFAVVASEIKALAIQTSTSANDISLQVRDIQNATKETSREMTSIKSVVMDANERVGAVTRAVDEQSSATEEVARNIHEVSESFTEAATLVARNHESLKNVSAHVLDLEKAARDVRDGAREVDENSEKLQELAAGMVRSVNAADS